MMSNIFASLQFGESLLEWWAVLMHPKRHATLDDDDVWRVVGAEHAEAIGAQSPFKEKVECTPVWRKADVHDDT